MKFFRMGIMLLFFLSLTSYAQSEVLSLKDCIQIALENNADLNTSRNLARITQLGVTDAFSRVLPVVNANFSGSKLKFGESTYLSDVPVGVDSLGKVIYEQRLVTTEGRERNSYSAGVSVTQKYFLMEDTGGIISVAVKY